MRFRSLLVSVAMIGLLAACGDNTTSSSDTTVASSPTATEGTTGAVGPTTTVAGALPTPEVKLPSALPTELVITDLTDGTGTGAVSGDTVVVHYVGVLSADGTEFDNSYKRGTPFPVQPGSGQVIKGWDQGLIGAKKGGRRQLDVPADLAYGDTPSGDIIKAGDALTFVIDVVDILPKPIPADAPTVSITPTPNQTDQTFTDLIVGDGPGINPNQTVAVRYLAFSAVDGKALDSSWDTGQTLVFIPGAGLLPPGLEKAVEGMKVGGLRQVDIPFADAFGEAGNENLGLPASTDLIMVLALLAVY